MLLYYLSNTPLPCSSLYIRSCTNSSLIWSVCCLSLITVAGVSPHLCVPNVLSSASVIYLKHQYPHRPTAICPASPVGIQQCSITSAVCTVINLPRRFFFRGFPTYV
eukprot:scpid15233/ scgid21622/ 